MTATGMRLPEMLRAQTAADHRHAEQGAFQQRLISGRLSPQDYRQWLGQMCLVHEAIEAALPAVAACGRGPARLAQLVAGKTDLLRADLAALGGPANQVTPTPPTLAFTELVRGAANLDPHALIGALYVLEGSTNGNRFIAARLRATWAEGDRACAYLDAYGSDQPRRWAEFKVALDEIPPDEHAAAIVGVARETFAAIRLMGDQIEAAMHDNVPPR